MLAAPVSFEQVPAWLAYTVGGVNVVLALLTFRVGVLVGSMRRQIDTMWDWYILNTQRIRKR